ncbi:MAG TPA: hypothetical protein VLB12_02070, partial [Gemmatimonadales bacterium]|nr:hypothetical protein [Gemmatimonadales bacterium]
MYRNLVAGPAAAIVGALFVLGVAGCSNDSTGMSNETLTQAEANDVGQEVEAQVASVVGASPIVGVMNPAAAIPPAGGNFGPLGATPGCPDIAPLAPADADGDNVPDSVTVSFTLPECSFSGPRGRTLVVTGEITVTDPSNTLTGFRVRFEALSTKVTFPNGSFFRQQFDGVRQLLASTVGFSVTDSITAIFESTARGTASLENAWQADFTVDQGGSFEPHSPLPSGTAGISGTTVRTLGEVSKTFTVTTPVPLHYNAGCTGDQR